jgi:hypothetical protein
LPRRGCGRGRLLPSPQWFTASAAFLLKLCRAPACGVWYWVSSMGGGAAYSSILIPAPRAGSSSPALNSPQHSIHHRRRHLPRGSRQPRDPSASCRLAERGEDPPAGNGVGDVEETGLVVHPPHEVRYFRSNNGDKGGKVNIFLTELCSSLLRFTVLFFGFCCE